VDLDGKVHHPKRRKKDIQIRERRSVYVPGMVMGSLVDINFLNAIGWKKEARARRPVMTQGLDSHRPPLMWCRIAKKPYPFGRSYLPSDSPDFGSGVNHDDFFWLVLRH